MDVHGVALESTHQPPFGALFRKRRQVDVDLVVVLVAAIRDDDAGLIRVIDKPKPFSGRPKRDGERCRLHLLKRDDLLAVEISGPIQGTEIRLEPVAVERIAVDAVQGRHASIRCFAHHSGRRGFRWNEHDDLAFDWNAGVVYKHPLPIASSRRLGNRIEARQRPVDDREVQIDTGLDEARAHHAQGRYANRYSKRDVSQIINKLERSSNTFRIEFDRSMEYFGRNDGFYIAAESLQLVSLQQFNNNVGNRNADGRGDNERHGAYKNGLWG